MTYKHWIGIAVVQLLTLTIAIYFWGFPASKFFSASNMETEVLNHLQTFGYTKVVILKKTDNSSLLKGGKVESVAIFDCEAINPAGKECTIEIRKDWLGTTSIQTYPLY